MEDSPLDAHKKDALTGSLLHTAVVAVGILEPQTHFGSVFLEVKELFGVEGSTSLPIKSRAQKIKTTPYTQHHSILRTSCLYCNDQKNSSAFWEMHSLAFAGRELDEMINTTLVFLNTRLRYAASLRSSKQRLAPRGNS